MKMECGDKRNVDLGSMDLYSKVKLRALTRKHHTAQKNALPAADREFVDARLLEFESNFSTHRSLLDSEGKQTSQNAIAVETSGLEGPLVEVTVKEIDERKNYRKGVSMRGSDAHNFDDSDYIWEENQAWQNAIAVEIAGLGRSLVDVTVKEIDERKKYRKTVSTTRSNACNFNDSTHILEEKQARQNAIAVEAARLERSLVAVEVKETDEWKNHKKDTCSQRSNAHNFDYSDNILEEKEAWQNANYAIAVDAAWLGRSLVEVEVKEIDERKNHRKDISAQRSNACNFGYSNYIMEENQAWQNATAVKAARLESSLVEVTVQEIDERRNYRKDITAQSSYVRYTPTGAQFELRQKHIRSDGAINAGKKRNNSGFLEFPSLQKPVRQKNLKDLASISDNQKQSELHNEQGTGIETSSSIKQCQPLTESSSIESHVEPDQPLMLVMKFPSGVILPSFSELKDKFTPFGPLRESSIKVLWESSRCQLVFHRNIDAAEAYMHATQNGSLFSSPVRYDLQMDGGAGPELPETSQSYTPPTGEGNVEIQPEILLSRADYFCESKPKVHQLQSLEKFKREPYVEGPCSGSVSAIPFLASNSCRSCSPPVEGGHREIQTEPLLSTAEYFNELMPTVPRFLLPEEIKKEPCAEDPRSESGYEIPFLESNSCYLGTLQHMIPVASQWTSLGHTSQPFGFNQSFDDIDKTDCQVEGMKNNDSDTIPTSTSARGTQKKDKLIDILYRCNEIFGIKPFF